MRGKSRPELHRLTFIIPALLIASLRPLSAVERTVWQIGNFDQSSHEFNEEVDRADAKYNPVSTVGESNSAKDWPAYQPGSGNKSTGGHPYPYTILFRFRASRKVFIS